MKFMVIGVDIDEWPADELPFIPWHAMSQVPDWKKKELIQKYNSHREKSHSTAKPLRRTPEADRGP